jgi:hypothetical protein
MAAGGRARWAMRAVCARFYYGAPLAEPRNRNVQHLHVLHSPLAPVTLPRPHRHPLTTCRCVQTTRSRVHAPAKLAVFAPLSQRCAGDVALLAAFRDASLATPSPAYFPTLAYVSTAPASTMELLKKNLSPLRFCEGGPFELTCVRGFSRLLRQRAPPASSYAGEGRRCTWTRDGRRARIHFYLSHRRTLLQIFPPLQRRGRPREQRAGGRQSHGNVDQAPLLLERRQCIRRRHAIRRLYLPCVEKASRVRCDQSCTRHLHPTPPLSTARSSGELAALAEARAEFESLIKPYEKKHHDDLCEAWAIKQPNIHAAFLTWVPLARKTFDLEEKLVDDFTAKASPGVLDAFTTALRAAKRRLDDETAAANAVVLDPRAAKKAAKLAEKERLKKEAEEEEGGGKAKKAQKKVRRARARHFTRFAGPRRRVCAHALTHAPSTPHHTTGHQGGRAGRRFGGCSRGGPAEDQVCQGAEAQGAPQREGRRDADAESRVTQDARRGTRARKRETEQNPPYTVSFRSMCSQQGVAA